MHLRLFVHPCVQLGHLSPLQDRELDMKAYSGEFDLKYPCKLLFVHCLLVVIAEGST